MMTYSALLGNGLNALAHRWYLCTQSFCLRLRFSQHACSIMRIIYNKAKRCIANEIYNALWLLYFNVATLIIYTCNNNAEVTSKLIFKYYVWSLKKIFGFQMYQQPSNIFFSFLKIVFNFAESLFFITLMWQL